MSKKKYEKPTLKRLNVINNKVTINGKSYYIEEIFSEKPLKRYYIAHTTLYMKINHTHFQCTEY